MQPFAVDLFKGMLAFFLLDMGLLAARNMGELQGQVAMAAGLCDRPVRWSMRRWRWRCARRWA